MTVAELVVGIDAKSGILAKQNWYRLISSAGYIIFIIAGTWLLRGPSFFYRMAFQEAEPLERTREFFVVGTKLFGVLLAIGTVPRLLDALTYFFLFATSAYAGPAFSSKSYFLPPLGAIFFGSLLFFRGELLGAWAFAERSSAVDSLGNG